MRVLIKNETSSDYQIIFMAILGQIKKNVPRNNNRSYRIFAEADQYPIHQRLWRSVLGYVLVG